MSFVSSHIRKSVWLVSFLFSGSVVVGAAHAQKSYHVQNNSYVKSNHCVDTGEVEKATVLINGKHQNIEWRYYQCVTGIARL